MDVNLKKEDKKEIEKLNKVITKENLYIVIFLK